jgi:hypothetical protein
VGILSLCITVHGSRKDAWCTKPPGSRVSGLSGSGCKFLRSLRLGGRDEHVGRQMALLKFQKGRTRTSDRQTAHVGLSNFRLTHEGKAFAGLSAYVPKFRSPDIPPQTLGNSTYFEDIGAYQNLSAFLK